MISDNNYLAETKQLRTFVMLAETLNFTRAADRLHVAQSALSVRIKELEEQLGVVLLDRDRRKVSLTTAGHAFLADARELLSQLERATLNARRAAKGEVGRLRIGFVTSAATIILPTVVRQYRESHPFVQLDICNLTTLEQVERLKDGSLDVAFLRLPIRDEHLAIELVSSEPFIAFLPSNHRLAGQECIQVHDLSDDPFVMYVREQAPGFHDLIMRILNESGFSPVIAQEAGEMQMILNLVSAALGVTVLPESAKLLGTHGVVSARLEGEWPTSDLGLATRRMNGQSELVRAFAQQVYKYRSGWTHKASKKKGSKLVPAMAAR